VLFTPFGGNQIVTADALNNALTAVSPAIVYKTGSTSATSDTTVDADPHLTSAVDANSTYVGYFVLFMTGTDASDFKYSLTVPTGATGFHVPMGLGTAVTDSAAGTLNVNGTSTFSTTKAVGTDASFTTVAMIHVVVNTSVTAGSVTLQWAQNTSDATATQLFAGSYLLLWKMP